MAGAELSAAAKPPITPNAASRSCQARRCSSSWRRSSSGAGWCTCEERQEHNGGGEAPRTMCQARRTPTTLATATGLRRLPSRRNGDTVAGVLRRPRSGRDELHEEGGRAGHARHGRDRVAMTGRVGDQRAAVGCRLRAQSGHLLHEHPVGRARGALLHLDLRLECAGRQAEHHKP